MVRDPRSGGLGIYFPASALKFKGSALKAKDENPNFFQILSFSSGHARPPIEKWLGATFDLENFWAAA